MAKGGSLRGGGGIKEEWKCCRGDWKIFMVGDCQVVGGEYIQL